MRDYTYTLMVLCGKTISEPKTCPVPLHCLLSGDSRSRMFSFAQISIFDYPVLDSHISWRAPGMSLHRINEPSMFCLMFMGVPPRRFLNTDPNCFGGLAEQAVIPVEAVGYLALNDTGELGLFIKRRSCNGRNSRIRYLGQAFCRYLGMIK